MKPIAGPLIASLAGIAIATTLPVLWPGGSSLFAGTTKDLHWGEPVAGLQMAATVEVPAGAVHCWIRNAENHTVTYNSYNLGYFAYFGIEAQDPRGSWTRLGRKPDSRRIYQGVGPTEINIAALAPGGVIPPCYSERSGVVGAVSAPANLKATLVLDLGDFQWPENILQQPKMEIRVVQGLAGPGMPNGVDGGYSPMFDIRSPTFQLDGTTMRSFLDQYDRAAGKMR